MKLEIKDILKTLDIYLRNQEKGNFSFPVSLNCMSKEYVNHIIQNFKNRHDDYNILEWDIGEMLATEFTGIGFLDSNNYTDYKTIFPNNKTILVLKTLDAYTDENIKSSLHSIISERQINGHKIGKEIFIIFISEIDEYVLKNNLIDVALLDRLKIIESN